MLLSRVGMVRGGMSNSSIHTRGCPSTALPLSLQQGQPVPTISLEQETPWGGGSSGRGLLAVPPAPFLFAAWGCAGQMCAGDEGRPVSWS